MHLRKMQDACLFQESLLTIRKEQITKSWTRLSILQMVTAAVRLKDAYSLDKSYDP